MKPTKEWLKEARDYIEKNGWVQGSYNEMGHGNGCCMVGALRQVAADELGLQLTVYDVEKSNAVYVLAEVVGKEPWETPAQAVIRYNDEDDRRYEEVLAVFDRAIEAGL